MTKGEWHYGSCRQQGRSKRAGHNCIGMTPGGYCAVYVPATVCILSVLAWCVKGLFACQWIRNSWLYGADGG